MPWSDYPSDLSLPSWTTLAELLGRFKGWSPFLLDSMRYRRLEHEAASSLRLRFRNLYPRLNDRFAGAGLASGHYFHQDVWAARRVFDAAPSEHVDVGSQGQRVRGAPTEFPRGDGHRPQAAGRRRFRLRFLQADIRSLPQPDRSVESLSCLHAIEHVGLGRYGDGIDPRGHIERCASFSVSWPMEAGSTCPRRSAGNGWSSMPIASSLRRRSSKPSTSSLCSSSRQWTTTAGWSSTPKFRSSKKPRTHVDFSCSNELRTPLLGPQRSLPEALRTAVEAPPTKTLEAPPRRNSASANAVYSLLTFAWPVLLVGRHSLYCEWARLRRLRHLCLDGGSPRRVRGVLDLGVVPALVKFVSDAVARRGLGVADRAIGTAFSFYAVVGTIAGVSLFLASPWLVGLLNVPADLHDAGLAAFRVTGGAVVIFMLKGALAALPMSIQRYDIVAKVTLPSATLLTSASIVFVALGYGVVALVVVNVVLTALSGAMYLLISRRLLHFRVRFGFDRALGRRFFSFGSISFVYSATNLAQLFLDRLLVGSLLGVGAVTFYVLPNTVAMLLYSVAYAALNVVFPVSSALFATADHQAIRRLYIRATRFTTALVLATGVPLLAFARPILKYWLGGDFPARSTAVLMLLIPTYACLSLGLVGTFFAYGAGRLKGLVLFQVVATVMNVVLIFALNGPLGLNGIALAYLLSVAPLPIFIRYVERDRGCQPPNLAGHCAASHTASRLARGPCWFVLRPLATSIALVVCLLVVGMALFPLAYFGLRLAPGEDRQILASVTARARSVIAR